MAAKSADLWADLGIPDFLRLAPEGRREAWKRQPPKGRGDTTATKRPFHLPKSIEPEGLKLLNAAECEAERKKVERLEMLKALPKKPRIKRKPRHAKRKAPTRPKGRRARKAA